MSLPWCRSLDAPVPQTGDQLPDILSFFGALLLDTEQVIDVPKILLDDVPMRAAELDTQLGEQLVEVPTDPGYALAVVASKLCSRRELRQIIAGLQGGGRGARGGLQGSRAGLNSTENLAQTVENSVPQVRREGGGSVQGSLSLTFQLVGFLTDHVIMVVGCGNDASQCQYWIVRYYWGEF